jgi:hypothetical protein
MANATQVLALLRENDPARKSVFIRLAAFSDNELSEAFQTNEHVNNIKLYLGDMVNPTDWNFVAACYRDTYESGTSPSARLLYYKYWQGKRS